MNRKSRVICCFLLSTITTFSISLNAFAWGSSRHGSMVQDQSDTYFTKGGVNYKAETVAAAQYTDTESYMDAGSILPVGSAYIISPYHAKANLSCTTLQASSSNISSAEAKRVGYSFSSVESTANFLYNLAKAGISGNNINLSSSVYTDKVQKRIVTDLKKLIVNRFSNTTSNYKQGYIILGVYLHLIQDIPAHRTVVNSSLIKNEMNKSDFSDYNGAIKAADSNGGIPMIRLKDYLNGNLYEDKTSFLPTRYSVAKVTTNDEVTEIYNGGSFSFPNYANGCFK